MQEPLLTDVAQRAMDSNVAEAIVAMSDDRTERPANTQQRASRRRSILGEVADVQVAEARLERILGGNELSDVNYLQKGAIAARSVGRVVIRRGDRVVGYGTGSLVAPGVMMTNEHVLSDTTEVGDSSFQLGYEYAVDGTELEPVEFRLRADPPPIISAELDVAIVAVEPVSTKGATLDTYGWLRLDPTPGKGIVGEYLTIVQHPGGDRKQVCVRENKLLKYDHNGIYVWYQSDTVGGSSGSPAFNNSWDVVALHHSAVPRTKTVKGKQVVLDRNGKPWKPEMGDDAIDWYANEGIRISRIMDLLRVVHPAHPLARAVLDAERPPADRTTAVTPEGAPPTALAAGDGVLRFNVPVEIRLNVPATAPRTSAAQPAGASAAMKGFAVLGTAATSQLEKVEVDQSNYGERNGYDPNFLGEGFRVPPPKLAPKPANKPPVLAYWNYTVCMNTDRRLASWSAANVDPALFKGTRDKAGDRWFTDTRVAAASQVGEELYGRQKLFEANRAPNPFDRGHLTARGQLQWGAMEAEAKRNGDDSFHFTNCAPQHWSFNQNSSLNGLWFALEDETIKRSGGSRLCVINGPIFDAPASIADGSGLWRLDPQGPRRADPLFTKKADSVSPAVTVAVPTQFFKIIAWVEDDRLRVAGFLVTQEGPLRSIGPRLHWPDATPEHDEKAGLTDTETQLYSLPVATIGTLAGLNFGAALSAADIRVNEAQIGGVTLLVEAADVRRSLG